MENEQERRIMEIFNKLPKKPPLGVMPKEIYERRRIEELLRALVDYAWEGQSLNLDAMIPWSKELTARLEGLKLES